MDWRPLFDETDDSPESATGTIYEWNIPTDEITYLVWDDVPRENTRRGGHFEEHMDEICPVTPASEINIRPEVGMKTGKRTSTKSSETPSVYDSREWKTEDDEVQAMENRSSALKYYTPQSKVVAHHSTVLQAGIIMTWVEAKTWCETIAWEYNRKG